MILPFFSHRCTCGHISEVRGCHEDDFCIDIHIYSPLLPFSRSPYSCSSIFTTDNHKDKSWGLGTLLKCILHWCMEKQLLHIWLRQSYLEADAEGWRNWKLWFVEVFIVFLRVLPSPSLSFFALYLSLYPVIFRICLSAQILSHWLCQVSLNRSPTWHIISAVYHMWGLMSLLSLHKWEKNCKSVLHNDGLGIQIAEHQLNLCVCRGISRKEGMSSPLVSMYHPWRGCHASWQVQPCWHQNYRMWWPPPPQ